MVWVATTKFIAKKWPKVDVNFDKESMRYKKDAILLLSVKIAKLFFCGEG